MLTIFTPVYNRADIIGCLYQSLLSQTVHDFEWLVIDDGSTDSIAEVFHSWMEEGKAPFRIRFYRQKNGGKHRAVNRAVQLAEGEAFFIVDSDDWLTDDAVELIHKWWKDVEDNDAYAGVSGLKGNRKGEAVGGTPAFETYIDATNMEREKYGLSGDKAEVYKTSVLKRNPFPEFDGENFLTEAVVLDKIAYDGLKLRWFNRVIYLCEYREDGLTRQGRKIFVKNPVGWGFCIRQKCGFYRLSEEEKIWLYLEYYIWLKDRLPDRDIQDNLGTDPGTLEEVKECHRRCIAETVQNIGKKIALYGAGIRGQKVYRLYEHTEIEISCVMDRRKTDMPCRQIGSDGQFPAVDAVIVTPQKGQEEIIRFLKDRTTGRLIGYDEWKACIGLGGDF